MNHEVTVELKNDISVRGTLKSVDQYLNIKLDDISVVEELKYPHLVSQESKQYAHMEEVGTCWVDDGHPGGQGGMRGNDVTPVHGT